MTKKQIRELAMDGALNIENLSMDDTLRLAEMHEEILSAVSDLLQGEDSTGCDGFVTVVNLSAIKKLKKLIGYK
jgi:hypothetical protein